MSGDVVCKCRPRNARVVHRLCNFSAFNGYHRTPSAYSRVLCGTCGHTWRSKAEWVDRARDVPPLLDRSLPLPWWEPPAASTPKPERSNG